MRIESWQDAFEVALFADQHDAAEIRQLIDQGFEHYRVDGGKEMLREDVEHYFQQSMDPDVRKYNFDEPPLESPQKMVLLGTLAANAVRKHDQFENAPPSKIQIIQYLREYHTRMLIAHFWESDPEIKTDVADKLYKAEIDPKRPRPAGGTTGLKNRPDEHPEFDWFFEMPLVFAGDLCKARFHEGKWGPGYDDETKSALGETNYHIDNNCIYMPLDHAVYHLAHRQEDTFIGLVETTNEFYNDEEVQWVYNETRSIRDTIDDLIKHGDNDDLWTDWDPQQNLLRLTRNAAQTDDDLDPAEYNEAEAYYEAIQNYTADGFGERSAKKQIKGTKSLAMKLTNLAKSDDFRVVDIRRYDRGTAEYTVGRNSGNVRQVPVETLEDIFELPCFNNMKDDLKLKNSGPVRKQLYNFVRMVYWLQGYHDLPDSQREDAVVSDIHDLFETKWDWYDRETTDYQARYELRNGEVNGNTPLPMSCDNPDMEHHCIGRRACPYSIYQSLPFPQEMYDQLEEMQQEGEYQSTI